MRPSPAEVGRWRTGADTVGGQWQAADMSTQTSQPPRAGWLRWDDYLRVLRLDAARMAEVGRMGLEQPVPSCPGWTVADALTHTAAVYLHKVGCMRQGAEPLWPPGDFDDSLPLALFDEATRALLDELESRDPYSVRFTWWRDDQTVGFWYRRMALETAVHRVDVELAHGVVTPIDEELAVDGIDEVLRIMLAGPCSDGDQSGEQADDRVRISGGGRSWTVSMTSRNVRVTESDAGAVAVEVAGSPDDLYLWLWGRRSDESLAVTGDAGVASAFRRRLAESTQ